MRKGGSSSAMIIHSILLLAVTRLALSDGTGEGEAGHKDKFFLQPTTKSCRTSLGEHGRCLPIGDCPNLMDYVEGKDKEHLTALVTHFGCGFHKTVMVCCRDVDRLKPFAGIDHLAPHPAGSPVHGHHHGEHPPHVWRTFDEYDDDDGWLPPSFGHEEGPPEKKAGRDDDPAPTDVVKPIYEERDDGRGALGGSQQNQVIKEIGDGSAAGTSEPNWERPDVTGPQGDSWLLEMQRNESASVVSDHAEAALTPDFIGVSQGTSNTGFGVQGQYDSQYSSPSAGRPALSGIFREPAGQVYDSNLPLNQGTSGFDRPTNQELFSSRPGSSSGTFQRPGSLGTVGSSDIGSSQGIFDNGGSLNSGFGSSRPSSQGLGFSNGQGSGSGRPSSSLTGLGSLGPQQFGGSSIERPSGQGFGNGRPESQGFGSGRPTGGFNNERPGSLGLGGSGSYETDGSRPYRERPSGSGGRPSGQGGFDSKRPTSQGGLSGGVGFGSGSLTSGEFGNQRPNSQRPGSQGSNKRPSGGGSGSRHPNRRLLPDGKCGSEISDKIIGGETAKLDEFPWMALLHFTTKNGQSRGYGCGGSLINERYVLTAAHCIKGSSLPSNVAVRTVRLGEFDLSKDRDCINGVCSPSPIDAAVEEIIVHPEYKPNDKGQFHDIALIRLRKKVPFSTYVSPICVPGDELKRKDYTGKQMVVSGWGKTANGENGQSSNTKQKVSLPFVSLSECKPFYDGINIRLRNTQMCAGGEKARDSCQGDSGGPLMSSEIINGQPSWFVTGIVSFGPEDCGVKNIAGVYTKVSEYVDWILDNMKE